MSRLPSRRQEKKRVRKREKEGSFIPVVVVVETKNHDQIARSTKPFNFMYFIFAHGKSFEFVVQFKSCAMSLSIVEVK